MKSKLLNFVALDLGSSKISAIAAHIDKKGGYNLLSHDLYHSTGIKSGVITDLKALESSVLNAIYTIEQECKTNIKTINISLSGAGTKSHYLTNKIKLSGQSVTAQDIKKLLQKMLLEFKLQDQEIIHYFPVEFVIDGKNIVDNPVGMFGKELLCRLHIITIESSILLNIINCLVKCQIEVSNVMLAIYAAGLSCLFQEEKNLGSIIIDIGAKTTSVGIFLDNNLIYSDYVPIGSWHITSDIAKIFSISLATAEKLKVLHGNAVISPFEKDVMLNIEDYESDNQYNPNLVISHTQLTEVINCRVEEILLMIKERYNLAAVDHLIARRVIITGGGSALKSIKELASTIFEKQVRIAKPSHLPELIDRPNLGMYSVSIGILLNHVAKKQKKSLDFHNLSESNNWLVKIFEWFKENI